MSGISVIIPTFEDDFELTGLLAVLSNVPVQEIIIVDGETRPDPHFTFHYPHLNIMWMKASTGRGSQIATGIQRAVHENIWVLHADSRPSLGSADAVRNALANGNTSLFCFPLAFRTRATALSLFAWFSRFDSVLTTFGDQGFAFRKSDYDRLDLNLNHYALLEDVALRKALTTVGKVKKAKFRLLTSARRFERIGILRTQMRNLSILIRYWRGASPNTLHADYYNTTRQTVPASRPSWPEHRA